MCLHYDVYVIWLVKVCMARIMDMRAATLWEYLVAYLKCMLFVLHAVTVTSFWVRMGQSTFFRHGVTTGKLERVKEQRDTNEEDDRQFYIMACRNICIGNDWQCAKQKAVGRHDQWRSSRITRNNQKLLYAVTYQGWGRSTQGMPPLPPPPFFGVVNTQHLFPFIIWGR